MKTKTKIDITLTLIGIIILFALASYFTRQNIDFITQVISQNYFLGALIFASIEALAIVVAPLTSIPLIPIISLTYGPPVAFILLYTGEVIGSLVAFAVARKYGKKLVAKLISLEKTEKITTTLSEKNLFITLILLRITLPHDILSYSLGTLTKINYKIYTTTLLIGTIPSAIFFAYLGGFPIAYQLISWTAGISILIILFYIIFRKKSPNT